MAEVSTASGMSRQLLDVVMDLPGLATEDGGGVLSREDGGRIEAESPDPIPPESIVRWVPLDRMET